MATTYTEVIGALLSGKKLDWNEYQGLKPGSICLASSAERRLFEFLINQDLEKVKSGSETLFTDLIASWKDDNRDPAEIQTQEAMEHTASSWRLHVIESFGFGGLNLCGGPEFRMEVCGHTWCLEGQNGSGKTSLVSAIVWALTGKRIREHMGPVEDVCERKPVLDVNRNNIGSWPPLVAYPESIDGLMSDAEVWVRLTFKNESGEIAEAFRHINSSFIGDDLIEVDIDSRLLVAPQLIETGLLMPCRMSKMGFGNESQSLYEAVKALTGLDKLSDISDGVANQFAHGGRKFMKYAKDHGIELIQNKFNENIAKAVKNNIDLNLKIDLSGLSDLHTHDVVKKIKDVAVKAQTDAGEHLKVLESDVAETIDVNTLDGREKIRSAVATAKVLVSQGVKEIPIFVALKALDLVNKNNDLESLSTEISASNDRLGNALHWHIRQNEDRKLRLKALASQWYEPVTADIKISDCPLCESPLVSSKQKELASEMELLKQQGVDAERKLEDVCASLETLLRDCIPKELQSHVGILDEVEPKQAISDSIIDNFSRKSPFKDILIAVSGITIKSVSGNFKGIPVFEFKHSTYENNDVPDCAVKLLYSIQSYSRLLVLAKWWSENRTVFVEAWLNIKGEISVDDKYPEDTLNEQLEKLDQALAKATPFDETASYLLSAAESAESWLVIKKEQDTREEIKKALEPLKSLRHLVEIETARSITELSGRITNILGRIHLRERLDYRETMLSKKKTVHVLGSFNDEMKIDAGLVANTSWLRAILWGFIIALREETVESLGCNPFPLFVLDDPQTTFDPRNKRKWAEMLAQLSNVDEENSNSTQIFLTTHENEFFHMLIDVENISGENGLIAPVDSYSRSAIIVNGSNLERQWEKADKNNNDSDSREYIRLLRVYVETLLKIMLRSEIVNSQSTNIDKIRRELLKPHHDNCVPPFHQPAFKKLLKHLDNDKPEIKIINGPPHSNDETIGWAQAKDVREFWNKSLKRSLDEAFHTYENFIAYRGDPRMFALDETVINFPTSQKTELNKIKLYQTGMAAAAKTDGLIGDGIVTVEEWDKDNQRLVSFHNHELLRLTAGTLEPVASIGDFLIINNYDKAKPRDLVISAVGDKLLARRLNITSIHPDIMILTAHSVDPKAISEPVIVPKQTLKARKIVGVLFSTQLYDCVDSESEVSELSGIADYWDNLDMSRLFKVKGRSAEPIALDGQLLITKEAVNEYEKIQMLDGRLVVAFDDSGSSYFKRLRLTDKRIVILESLNPDGIAGAELLGLDESLGFPVLTHVLPVTGVLFEM